MFLMIMSKNNVWKGNRGEKYICYLYFGGKISKNFIKSCLPCVDPFVLHHDRYKVVSGTITIERGIENLFKDNKYIHREKVL